MSGPKERVAERADGYAGTASSFSTVSACLTISSSMLIVTSSPTSQPPVFVILEIIGLLKFLGIHALLKRLDLRVSECNGQLPFLISVDQAILVHLLDQINRRHAAIALLLQHFLHHQIVAQDGCPGPHGPRRQFQLG